MPDPLGSASFTVLALYVLGFFSSLTVVALAIGFGIERAFGRSIAPCTCGIFCSCIVGTIARA